MTSLTHRCPRRPGRPDRGGAARAADVVQIFLGDPQGWKNPDVAYAGGGPALKAAAERRASGCTSTRRTWSTSATTNNRIRIPSRKLLQHTSTGRPRSVRAA